MTTNTKAEARGIIHGFYPKHNEERSSVVGLRSNVEASEIRTHSHGKCDYGAWFVALLDRKLKILNEEVSRTKVNSV
jgi:hypothetical protein